jgi:hypothetical protein
MDDDVGYAGNLPRTIDQRYRMLSGEYDIAAAAHELVRWPPVAAQTAYLCCARRIGQPRLGCSAFCKVVWFGGYEASPIGSDDRRKMTAGLASLEGSIPVRLPSGLGIFSPRQAQCREGDPGMRTRIYHSGSRRFLPILLSVISSLPTWAQTASDGSEAIASSMQRLSIQLPSAVAGRYAVRKALEELNREHCDQNAIVNLGKALDQEGYRREAATAHVNFSDSCGVMHHHFEVLPTS